MKTGKVAARRPSPKAVVKKSARRGVATKRSGIRGAGRPVERLPAGFVTSSGTARLLIPEQRNAPVPAGKLRQGMRDVKRQIDETLHDLIESLTGDYEIREIELVASFNADGKFLGFGVGGAASIEITICPCE